MDSLDGRGGDKTPRESRDSQRGREKLLAKRHTQKIEGIKLPENLRSRAITFRELCDDALVHSRRRTAKSKPMSSVFASTSSSRFRFPSGGGDPEKRDCIVA